MEEVTKQCLIFCYDSIDTNFLGTSQHFVPSFFRSEKYQEYFRYLDSFNGFFLYRWGDHALRTIAVGMYLEPPDVTQMKIPYGHQGYCQCLNEKSKCYTEGRYYNEENNTTTKPNYYREDWRICVPPLPSAAYKITSAMEEDGFNDEVADEQSERSGGDEEPKKQPERVDSSRNQAEEMEGRGERKKGGKNATASSEAMSTPASADPGDPDESDTPVPPPADEL